jgi:hypothetical protein
MAKIMSLGCFASAEYKIQYIVSPGLSKQEYDVRLHLFFSTELDAAESLFYTSLFEMMRLHTSKVCCIQVL